MNVDNKQSIKNVIEKLIHGYNVLCEEDMELSQESVETAYKAIQCLMGGDSIQARMYAESAKDQEIKWVFVLQSVCRVHELAGGGDYI